MVINVGIQYIVHHTKATYIKLVYVDTDLDIITAQKTQQKDIRAF